MMSWRRLLTLEAKNGPLPGKQPKLPELIVKLKEVNHSYYIDILYLSIITSIRPSQEDTMEVKSDRYFMTC